MAHSFFSEPSSSRDWRDDAACLGIDPDVFFPAGSSDEDAAAAKAVCQTCDVRGRCLEYALEHREKEGIWGGYTEHERKRILKGSPQEDRVSDTFNPEPHQRIHVTFPDPASAGVGGESLWAERVRDGDEPSQGVYEVHNIPFFARGFSMHDLVLCDESDPDKLPEIIGVVERKGCLNVTVLFGEHVSTEEQAEAVLRPPEAIGGQVERAVSTVVVVAIKENVFDDGGEAILEKAHGRGLLDFEVSYPDETEVNG